LAARKEKRKVEVEDFHEARDKIVMGIERGMS
jgi:ATP-dependent Zn protease